MKLNVDVDGVGAVTAIAIADQATVPAKPDATLNHRACQNDQLRGRNGYPPMTYKRNVSALIKPHLQGRDLRIFKSVIKARSAQLGKTQKTKNKKMVGFLLWLC
jgi:hypothetical protein